MSGTAGPHLPKKGWRKRWSKQALELLVRSPDTLILAYIGVGVYCLLHAGVSHAIMHLIGEASVVNGLRPIVTVPLAVLISCFAMNMLMYADRGESLSFQEILSRSPSAIKLAMYITLLVAVVITSLGVWASSTADTAELNANLLKRLGDLKEIALMGSRGIIGDFTNLVIMCVFAAPAIIGMGWDAQEVQAMDRQMRNLSFTFYFEALFLFVFAGILIGLLPVFLHPAAFAFLIAVNYVGGREVFGGIDGNGEGAKDAVGQASVAGT